MLNRRHFLAALILLPLTAFASQPVIHVATSHYPPYEYLSDGEVVGHHTAIIRRVLNEMGYQAKIHMLPWARAERLVKTGEMDMLYSLTFSEARERVYFFTKPISSARDGFFKLSNRDLAWRTLDDLSGLNFGLSAAYSYPPAFMDWLLNGNAHVTRISHEQPELTGLRMVGLGRIDLFICELSVCEYLLAQQAAEFAELAKVERMPGDIGPPRSFRAAFSRALPNGRKLRDQFDRVLSRLTIADRN